MILFAEAHLESNAGLVNRGTVTELRPIEKWSTAELLAQELQDHRIGFCQLRVPPETRVMQP